MIWGIGLLTLLGLATWWLREPGAAPMGRAFGVLVFYGVVFWLTLFKIWWTAGKSAVIVERGGLAYRPLHTFSLKRISFARTFFCGPREATESLRLIHERKPGRAQEFFLNLAVIDRRHEFLEVLGQRLEDAGLERVLSEPHTWRRSGWDLELEA